MEQKRKNQDMDKRKIPDVSIGLNMAAGMIFFAFLGNLFDRNRGQGYAGTLVGMFMGLFYCGYEVWKLVRNSNQEESSR